MAWAERKRRWDSEHYFRSLRAQGGPGHLSQLEIERMREMRRAGRKVYEISDEMGISKMTVVQHTKDIGSRNS